MDINNLRKQIDTLDDQLMALLNERFEIARTIGQLKKQNNQVVLDSSREDSILKKTDDFSHNEAISTVFKTILNESKSIQRKL